MNRYLYLGFTFTTTMNANEAAKQLAVKGKKSLFDVQRTHTIWILPFSVFPLYGPVFSIFPCSPLPSGTWRTPFPDVVFPPLPLSALSSSPLSLIHI